MTALSDALWPRGRAADAVEALTVHLGVEAGRIDHAPEAPEGLLDDDAVLDRWIEAVAGSAGATVERIETTYAELGGFLSRGAPALVSIPGAGIAALTGNRRGETLLVGPDRLQHRVPRASLRAALVNEIESPHRVEVDRLLDELDVPASRRDHARAVILDERLGREPIGSAWLVRLREGASVKARLRRSRIPARLSILLTSHALEYGLWLLAWGLIGRAVLEGRIDPGWLVAWMILLVTLVPLRVLESWLAGSLTVEAGGLLRRRLLTGALRLEPEEMRHQGVGQLLGRVLEADSVDALALGGGLATLTAAMELLVVLGVLVASSHVLIAGLLLGWIALVLALGWICLRRRRAWSEERLRMTHDLVEGMVGHRTRQAQEEPAHWQDAEDQALEQYQARSRSMDRVTVLLESLAARGWLAVGLAGLAPAFVGGVSTTTLAVALGAILLASRALQRVAGGLAQLADATIAWEQIAPLFTAAARPSSDGAALAHVVAGASASSSNGWLVEAHDLTFRHAGRVEPVLSECSVRIRAGDRILLEGPSGSGKSTLASLLVGLRLPQSGLLLLDGLDRQSLGAREWRRRVVAAPQFHENHVLSGTFLFNALMGTDRWPPRQIDFDELQEVCNELGLGDLLARMPAGPFQMVGETGWQLSHGERSRLYVARALLRHADLVVLDESFGALDPENLARALRCVLARARTLLVIAHP